MGKRCVALCLLSTIVCLTLSTLAQERASSASVSKPSAPLNVYSTGPNSGATPSATAPTAAANRAAEERTLRAEGEQRFRTNCGRCHMPPHKFPPRMMATAIRHMRVRAMITDEDMRLILRYMTQ